MQGFHHFPSHSSAQLLEFVERPSNNRFRDQFSIIAKIKLMVEAPAILAVRAAVPRPALLVAVVMRLPTPGQSAGAPSRSPVPPSLDSMCNSGFEVLNNHL
jgi:hypothetical protein